MPNSKIILLFTLLIIGLSWKVIDPPPITDEEKTAALFQKQIERLQLQLDHFNTLCGKNAGLRAIQISFRQCRIRYKEAAVLLEYFYPGEKRLLNGPDLRRAEEDNPDKTLEPHGFQVMERIIFSGFSKDAYSPLKEETTRLQRLIESIRHQPNLLYKFKKEAALDALKSAVIKMTAQGITGFDSPLAAHALPEADATLSGIRDIVAIYQQAGMKQWLKIDHLIALARNYLRSNNDFNAFDRLEFITRYADPLFGDIVEMAINQKALLPTERRPLNQYAKSIFAEELFDINFFSPNERYQVTDARIRLGKILFYDTVLSGRSNRSCATCHQPGKAFTDGLPRALAIDGKSFTDRNTPTLWNAALQTSYFYDSRVSTLENQLSVVVHSAQEMRGSLKESIITLGNDKKYAALFREAYPADEWPVTAYTIANAVSSYVRSLRSANSAFDRYMRGQTARLSAEEKSGFNLFAGKAKCATCHYLPLFNGLAPPEFTETESETLGTPAFSDTLHAVIDGDKGKFLFTNAVIHQHAFKTPTLRNIALTAPYMHNGVYQTLEETIDFYNKGGGAGLHIALDNQTLPAEKLGLTQKEAQNVIAFLKTLTDTAALNYAAPIYPVSQ